MRRAAGPAARDARWADPATIHLTLAFLGEVPAARVEEIGRVVEAVAAAGGPLELEVAGLGAFPSPRRPRVLWLGVRGEVERLRELAGALGARLAPASAPAPSQRPFSPHLTLARARSPRGAPSLAPLLRLPPPGPLPWRAEALVLFESHLGPGGARHEVLRRAPLGAPC